MKKLTLIFALCLVIFFTKARAQTFTPVGNTSYIGLDKNLLFNATSRYQVTQTGTRQFSLPSLFDGSFMVDYKTGFDESAGSDVVIEIVGLPAFHTQLGAFIGFTTRYFPPRVFKIEGYDVFGSYNGWRTIADVNDNLNGTYTVATPPGEFTKLRFTFSKSFEESGAYAGWIGLSELFFVHNEAASAYDGLMVQYSSNGNVGIGTGNPDSKLSVNGNIRAREIKVETANWPDYVFAKDYQIPTLEQTKQHIREKGHLPGIPSAEDVNANGVDLGDMNAKLLKKIEEMTLYLIELSDTVKNQQTEINKLKKR